MGIILWVVFGGLVGWIASIIMKTNEKQGLAFNIFVGIIGAFIGGLVMTIFGKGPVNGFNFYSFIVALIGAIILLIIVKLIAK